MFEYDFEMRGNIMDFFDLLSMIGGLALFLREECGQGDGAVSACVASGGGSVGDHGVRGRSERSEHDEIRRYGGGCGKCRQ